MNSLQISMLGTSFSIKAAEDEAYLKKLLKYYRQIAEHVSKSEQPLSNIQVAVLSGLMLCDELYKEKSKKAVEKSKESEVRQQEAEIDAKIEEATLSMIKKLDEALKLSEQKK